MSIQFEITGDKPLVLDSEGSIKIWVSTHQEYFRCSREFWDDVTDMIQNPSKWKHCVTQQPTNK